MTDEEINGLTRMVKSNTLCDVLAALYAAKEYEAYEVIYKMWKATNPDAWTK